LVLIRVIYKLPDDLEADGWVGFFNGEGVSVEVSGSK
jgi:hypothetical protein